MHSSFFCAVPIRSTVSSTGLYSWLILRLHNVYTSWALFALIYLIKFLHLIFSNLPICLMKTSSQLSHFNLYIPPFIYYFISVVLQPDTGHGLLILEVLRSHTMIHQSAELLWMSDQLITETSHWQHTTFTTDKHPCPWQDLNPQSQQASRWTAALDCVATQIGRFTINSFLMF